MWSIVIRNLNVKVNHSNDFILFSSRRWRIYTDVISGMNNWNQHLWQSTDQYFHATTLKVFYTFMWFHFHESNLYKRFSIKWFSELNRRMVWHISTYFANNRFSKSVFYILKYVWISELVERIPDPLQLMNFESNLGDWFLCLKNIKFLFIKYAASYYEF